MRDRVASRYFASPVAASEDVRMNLRLSRGTPEACIRAPVVPIRFLFLSFFVGGIFLFIGSLYFTGLHSTDLISEWSLGQKTVRTATFIEVSSLTILT